ncbi:MAG: CoA pyrophosphatase [Gammaproteobacteria bacterium]|nr:CoA pyrophosphatase [Gammaproteobacteria bacterium]
MKQVSHKSERSMAHRNIKQKIRGYRPSLIRSEQNRLASVALILKDIERDPHMFFIERARNPDDPWSGQIAFPGGNLEKRDGNVRDTAIRETFEEVGLALDAGSGLGRLDDQQGRNNHREIPLSISCFIFHVDSGEISINHHEVGDSFWVSLDHLLDPGHRILYDTPYSSDPYPGIQFPCGRVLWGLTFRFVERFLEVIR